MKIEQRNIETLAEYANNARTHSDQQVKQIAASLAEFGWTNPLLVDDNDTIIAGHGRLMAAKSLGYTNVPVIRLSGLSEAQKRAYILADNKLAEQAGWDKELLKIELLALRDMDFNVDLVGFSEFEINEILPVIVDFGEGNEDDVPDLPERHVTVHGDVWQLGRHRLKCGDSTSAIDMRDLVGDGQVADMVFTDPPYNVDYKGGTAQSLKIKNDNMSSGKFYQFLFDVFTAANMVVDAGAPIYVCHSDHEGLNFRKSLLDSGWLLKSCLVWVKNQFVLGRLDYHQKHEPILYGWKSGAAHKWFGGRNKDSVCDDKVCASVVSVGDGFEITFGDAIQFCRIKVPSYEVLASGADDLTTVWRVEKPQRSEFHPTTKPVEIPRRAIVNSSKSGAVVLDPFLGSGATLIACEQTGRACRGMELDPKYCDVIITRWQQFAGKEAILVSSGESFREVSDNRLGV
jgi:DNA modification methylase